MKKRYIMINNFLGGLAWGFGTVVGATVVVALLLGIMRAFGYVPYIGEPFKVVVDQVDQQRMPLKK